MIKFVSVEPAEPIDLKEQFKKDFEAHTGLTDPKTELHNSNERELEDFKENPEKVNHELKQ